MAVRFSSSFGHRRFDTPKMYLRAERLQQQCPPLPPAGGQGLFVGLVPAEQEVGNAKFVNRTARRPHNVDDGLFRKIIMPGGHRNLNSHPRIGVRRHLDLHSLRHQMKERGLVWCVLVFYHPPPPSTLRRHNALFLCWHIRVQTCPSGCVTEIS